MNNTPDLKKQMDLILYRSETGDVSVNAYIRDESIWLTQRAMAELFDVQIPAISKHLSSIFEEGELVREATVSKMEIVQEEGSRRVKRMTDFYEYEVFNRTQLIESDFDRAVKVLAGKGGADPS